MKRFTAFLLTLSLLLVPMTIPTLALPKVGTFDREDPGYGAQLDDEVALIAYQALTDQLAPGVERIQFDLSHLGLTDWTTQVGPALQAAVAAYVFDHPESQYCVIEGYGRSGQSAVYYIAQHENAKQRKAELDAVLAEFKAGFDTDRPVMEQYRAIHDYVCSLAVYNHEGTPEQTDAYTAYGLLVLGEKVVCEGYAKSFKLLCDAVGLPCMLAVGETPANGVFTGTSNHMWNLVELDGAWYAVDTTWDDMDGLDLAGLPDVELSMPVYDYFLNNAAFLDGSPTQDHRASGEIYFVSDFPMTFSLPELSKGAYPGSENIDPETVTLTFTGSELTIPGAGCRYTLKGLPLNIIRYLTGQTPFSFPN